MKRWAIVAGIAALAAAPALADDGWKFAVDEQEHPLLTYSERGHDVFFLGCGHAFALHVDYPGTASRRGKASIEISNGAAKMQLKGEVEDRDGGEAGPPTFTQWDLGYRRQDPGLYEAGWRKLESRLFDLIDSGKPLRISAEGKTLELPPVTAPNWKSRFRKIC